MDKNSEQNNSADAGVSGESFEGSTLNKQTTTEEVAIHQTPQKPEEQAIQQPQEHSPCEAEPDEQYAERFASELNAEMVSLREEMTSIHRALEDLQMQLEVVQNSLRQLAMRVTDVASSLGAPRIRELYMRLLYLYDLVEPPPTHLSEDAVCFCGLVATQIEQFLEVNGVHKIETNGAVFNPQLHKPIGVVTDESAGNIGHVLSTKRNGFRTDLAVLRIAEVVVARGSTPKADVGASPPPESAIDDLNVDKPRAQQESE
jgi:molecular chaperone GrpE (heat shock protein)